MWCRYSNKCLGYAVYITAICVGSASSARAQGESAAPSASSPPSTSPLSTVSPPPDSSQSADYVRTHSADYQRKPTDPPKFDPNSHPSAAARTDATREVARPKPKPVHNDADAVIVPQVAEPRRQTQTDLEPGAKTAAPAPARATRPGPMIVPETDSQRADSRPATNPQPAHSQPTSDPAADPAPGADRPAATSLSWPSGEGTDPAPAAPDAEATGAAPAERWNDPWGEQPAAPRPRPTTRQEDPWADPPVTTPRPEQAPASGDGTMPPQTEPPPETDPPGPSN